MSGSVRVLAYNAKTESRSKVDLSPGKKGAAPSSLLKRERPGLLFTSLSLSNNRTP